MFNRLILLILFLIINTSLSAQTTAEYFNTIQNNPLKLADFLKKMPKGGDLHVHLTGSSLPENMLDYGKNDTYCMHPETLALSIESPCSTAQSLSEFSRDPKHYSAIIDAWSMRNFHPGHESGHDHFFNSFGKFFLLADNHTGEILNEITQHAALQNESYLELMVTPDKNQSGMFGYKIKWDTNLSNLRKTMLSHGLIPIIQSVITNINLDEKKREQLQQCGTASAQSACRINVRYLYQTLREQSPSAVFAQLLTGFEVVSRDPRFVGINMVQPEDGKISMRDYDLHMKMVAFLHKLYPNVHISLHAGELVPGLVPPSGLRSHIRSAVEVAHATRIGHGVDIAYEDNSEQLLDNMAKQHIMVEINLISNAAILNVEGQAHPILLYQKHHVPVALSTDDEGVLRSSLTAQYVKAVNEYHYDYRTLKNLVRNSITYSFLPGKMLWDDYNYFHVNKMCERDELGADVISKECEAFLNKNEKAKQQWEVEERFLRFESK